MPQPDDESQEALKRLQERLDALTAERKPKESANAAAHAFAGESYRLLGEVIGCILGGVGLGWFVDRLLHTTPIFLLAGLLAGTAASAYVAMKSGEHMDGKPPDGKGS